MMPTRRAVSHPGSALLLLAPALCSAALSFRNLDLRPLWLDEAYSVAFANNLWTDLFELIGQRKISRSLFYVILEVWVGAFGDGEFAVRSIGALGFAG